MARVIIQLLNCVRKGVGRELKSAEKHGEEFLRNISGIAPCFYSKGNHDMYLECVPQGITMLENSYVFLDENIVIGGISEYATTEWLDEFAALPQYHILLCHHPELYSPLLKERNIELIVSGHAHGGQIRIGGKGLYAPGQGFFPKYTKGVYDKRLVVSAGLSDNGGIIPRVNNPTEVVVLEMK